MPRLSLRATNQLQKLALGCVALVAMQSHAFATTAEIPSLPRTVTGVVTSDDRALQLDAMAISDMANTALSSVKKAISKKSIRPGAK